MRPSLVQAQAAPEPLVCVIPATGANLEAVTNLLAVPGRGVLIGAVNGLFFFNAADGQVTRAGPENLGEVLELLAVPGQGVLIRAVNGLFLFNAADGQVTRVGPENLGEVLELLAVPGQGVLIRGWTKLFFFDAADGQMTRAGTEDLGGAIELLAVPGGSVLIGAVNGLFLFNAADGQVTRVGSENLRGVSELLAVPGRGVLIRAMNGLFLFNAADRQVMQVGSENLGEVFELLAVPGQGVLIRAENGLFFFDAADGQVTRAGTEDLGGAIELLAVPGQGVLIRALNGLFLFNAADGQVTRADTENLGRVSELLAVPGQGVLIGAENGFFFFNAADGQVTQAGTEDLRGVFELLAVPGQGVLIGALNGLFLFDAADRQVTRAGPENLRGAIELLAIPGEGVLIGAVNGLFLFNAADGQVTRVGSENLRGAIELLAIPGQGVLIGAENGLFFGSMEPLAKAKVSPLSGFDDPEPSRRPITIRLLFEHPCAPVADQLGISLVASHEGQEVEPSELVRLASGTEPTVERAELVASALFDRYGRWTVALRQGERAVAAPLPYLIHKPLLERLAEAWQQIVGILGLVYIASFLTLLYRAHRSTVAFRILTDTVWARVLTWPFFFLRQAPAVQLWVLEPWFQEVRRQVMSRRAEHPFRFLDPPATGPEVCELSASALLSRLSDQGRIWLQGRTGMGKTTVFAAWEGNYFAVPDRATLADTAKAFGFVLILLPVRLYARLEPPDSKSPESWVIEAVRLRFEQYGLVLKDRSTWEAMLRSGRFAVAFDGTNEANRADAIAAFARQFPRVRIIATSQTGPPETTDSVWESWSLPRDITELREGLLRLWLGEKAGAILARRLVDSGLSQVIVSGYDLRLVADLVEKDPDGTPLPNGRVGLYRMVMAGAVLANGEPVDLVLLHRLAIDMTFSGRREFSDEEAQELGAGVIEAISKEGVRIVRRDLLGRGWEFRHDQMRAVFAALYLVEDMPTLSQMTQRIEDGKAFALPRGDQEALWSFVAALLSAPQVSTLWSYAMEDPSERGLLQAALQREADLRKLELFRSTTPYQAPAPSGPPRMTWE